MIVAVSSVLNEADIIAKTIVHLKAQGVDEVLISDGGSTDGTRDLLVKHADGYVLQDGPFDQGKEITHLAHLAREQGADWVIPFDADEFWIDPLGTTVAEVLYALPDTTSHVFAATYGHLDWTRRLPQKPLSKVCFRPQPGMVVAWGNHHVNGITGDAIHGVLEIRELQYRDWDHFLAKVEKARALFASWAVPLEHGHHMRRLTEMTDQQLADEWANYQSQPSTHAPIT